MTEDELLAAYGLDPSRIHRSGSASRAMLRLLVERDGPYPACPRCRSIVDTRLSGLEPWGPTVGHAQAVRQGGSDELANLRIEHRRCNLAAGSSDALPAVIARPVERV